MENTLDAMLVSYWNEILEYAVALGLETEEILRLIEKIGDREKFRTVSRVPGKAFGLWCLPKDLNALIIDMKKRGITPNLMEGIWNTNAFFEQQTGIGFVPAQKLWEMSNNHVKVLEDMNIVFHLCCVYERQSFIEGIKVGTRLVMELWK